MLRIPADLFAGLIAKHVVILWNEASWEFVCNFVCNFESVIKLIKLGSKISRFDYKDNDVYMYVIVDNGF